MSRWSQREDVPRGDDYDARWTELEAQGKSIHGEADLIEALLRSIDGDSVLDAGCGTGRVGRELALRGFQVCGVDLDPHMLETARAKAPDVCWIEADLVDVTVPPSALGSDSPTESPVCEFDVVAAPGNVLIFVAPGTEPDVVANLARHIRRGGLLVAGFQLGEDRYQLGDFDQHCADAGLELVQRWSTWDRQPFADGDYAVSLHRRL